MEWTRNEDLDDSWSQSFNADWKSPGDAYVPACNLDTPYPTTLGFQVLELQSSPLLAQELPPATASSHAHVTPPPQPCCKYLIKLMNPELKRDYSVHKVKSTKFETLDELRDCLSGALPCGFTQLGYIEPGHGLKGKMQWIAGDDDLTEMYAKYGKHDVLLWCFKAMDDQQSSCQPKKRKAAGDTASAKKLKQTASDHLAETLSQRITLRTECMKQLEIWHSLLEKGCITKEIYADVQQTILEDIKNL